MADNKDSRAKLRDVDLVDQTPSTSKGITGQARAAVTYMDRLSSLAGETVGQNGIASSTSTVRFKAEVLRKCIESGIQDPKTKLTNEALIVLDAGLRCMVVEMLSRSANQALGEQLTVVDVDHVEKILPQMMLDI